MGTPPATQARTFINDTGSQVTVGLLSLCDDVDDGVEVVVECGIVVNGERVTGSLNHLIGIGVVEGEVAPMLSLDKAGSYGEVVEASVHLALMEGGRDADRTVDLDAGHPEVVVEVYLCKGHLLNGSHRLRLLSCTRRECQSGHTYEQ